MPYNNNVPPASGGTLSGTRDPIRNNFTQIQTVSNVNHVDYDDADQGKHKFLQMPTQGSAPTTAATEGGLYVKNNGSFDSLFLEKQIMERKLIL